MTLIDLNNFIIETECIYEGERYSVRDNGAVFRHPRIGKRIRPNDNQWTFGKINSLNPYLHLSDVRIHRIVATAFYGEPPNPHYVVDHIDTNCRNNRPENLRWLTRLENALLNPITRKKIEFRCGSIEAFLENPSILNAYQIEPNFAWMRTVTRDEAQNCKKRMSLWVSANKKPQGGSLGEWIYEPIIEEKQIFGREPVSSMAITNALHFRIGQQVIHRQFGGGEVLEQEGHENLARLRIQFSHAGVKWIIASYVEPLFKEMLAEENKNESFVWWADYYFPYCPKEIGTKPLEAYFKNLKVGIVFAYNDDSPELILLKFIKIKENSSILVMCERESLISEREGFQPWLIIEITFKNGFFDYSKLDSYFEKDDADKAFDIAQGLEWADHVHLIINGSTSQIS